jgi:hypothetical protein
MPAYDEDIYAWAFEQVDSCGNVVLTSLTSSTLPMRLKMSRRRNCVSSPNRCRSCSPIYSSGTTGQLDVAEILDDSPSLRARIDEPRTFQLIWADALAPATTEDGHDWFPSECPWAIDDVLSEGWLPANASKLRHVDLRALAFNLDATYIRVSGKSGARIRYHRINVGRPTKGLNDKAGAIISRMALMICMLAPDVVDTILTMPSGTLGRLVKAKFRRARTPKHTRGLVKRRPASTVFRIRGNQR